MIESGCQKGTMHFSGILSGARYIVKKDQVATNSVGATDLSFRFLKSIPTKVSPIFQVKKPASYLYFCHGAAMNRLEAHSK